MRNKKTSLSEAHRTLLHFLLESLLSLFLIVFTFVSRNVDSKKIYKIQITTNEHSYRNVL